MIKCAHCKHKQVVTEQTHKKLKRKMDLSFMYPKQKRKMLWILFSIILNMAFM